MVNGAGVDFSQHKDHEGPKKKPKAHKPRYFDSASRMKSQNEKHRSGKPWVENRKPNKGEIVGCYT